MQRLHNPKYAIDLLYIGQTSDVLSGDRDERQAFLSRDRSKFQMIFYLHRLNLIPQLIDTLNNYLLTVIKDRT